jgi:hypothetical protein
MSAPIVSSQPWCFERATAIFEPLASHGRNSPPDFSNLPSPRQRGLPARRLPQDGSPGPSRCLVVGSWWGGAGVLAMQTCSVRVNRRGPGNRTGLALSRPPYARRVVQRGPSRGTSHCPPADDERERPHDHGASGGPPRGGARRLPTRCKSPIPSIPPWMWGLTSRPQPGKVNDGSFLLGRQ